MQPSAYTWELSIDQNDAFVDTIWRNIAALECEVVRANDTWDTVLVHCQVAPNVAGRCPEDQGGCNGLYQWLANSHTDWFWRLFSCPMGTHSGEASKYQPSLD